MTTIVPEVQPGNRVKIVSDGVGWNTHIYLVDETGAEIGEIPCTSLDVFISPTGPVECRLSTIGTILELHIPTKQVEATELLLKDIMERNKAV
jgi:hypothetical protein